MSMVTDGSKRGEDKELPAVPVIVVVVDCKDAVAPAKVFDDANGGSTLTPTPVANASAPNTAVPSIFIGDRLLFGRPLGSFVLERSDRPRRSSPTVIRCASSTAVFFGADFFVVSSVLDIFLDFCAFSDFFVASIVAAFSDFFVASIVDVLNPVVAMADGFKADLVLLDDILVEFNGF
jgi:hypothetical protein